MSEPIVTTLQNGFRVVTHKMPHLETVSLGIWVGVGARHEPEDLHGISHLLEHMAFKGTERRTAMRIAEEIEEIGGDLNAATSLENTSYYARVLKGDEGVALDVLGDILLGSLFDPNELVREKEVILQEIAACQDSPDELVYDLAQEAAYTGQTLGRPIIGTPESVSAVSPEQLKSYLAERYTPANMVLSAAGSVDHERLARHAEALFGGLVQGQDNGASPVNYCGGARASAKPFEQSHLLLGFEAPSYRNADFITSQVFSGLFGGGMSSRLFQEVRERRGLCYAIYSTAWGLSDTGLLAVHAATGPEALDELASVVVQELRRLAEDGPEEKEVNRAKAQLKAGLLMSLESSSARAEQMARHLMAHGRLIGSSELIANVEAVSGEQIRGFAEQLAHSVPSVAVVGAGGGSMEHATRTEQLFAAGRG